MASNLFLVAIFMICWSEIDADLCSSESCLNGGLCVNYANFQSTCVCIPGTAGARCEIITPCFSAPCANGGKCIESFDNTKYDCICFPGYFGPNCRFDQHAKWQFGKKQSGSIDMVTEETNQEKSEIDQNIVSSTILTETSTVNDKVQSKASTTSQTSTETSTANDKVQSKASTTTQTSSSSTTATINNQLLTPNVVTTSSTQQADNQPTKPDELNLCEPNPCNNGGTCLTNGINFVCTCAPGYTGTTCDGETTGSCKNSPCQNGGICTNDGSDFDCDCPDDYDDGDTCSEYQNPCSSSPCQHGGTCTRLSFRTFQCSCESDYVGNFCELKQNTKPCDNKPCNNGGTCVSVSDTTYTCNCPSAWTGFTCTTVSCLTGTPQSACTSVSKGRYAACSSCSNFYVCKPKRQKMKTCKKPERLYFDRKSRKCIGDSATCIK